MYPHVSFVGAGPGAEDLITLRGRRLLEEADLVLYAGSLVNTALLTCCKAGCQCRDSASMTLEEQVRCLREAAEAGQKVVRLHTGDPSLYGAIQEQMRALEAPIRFLRNRWRWQVFLKMYFKADQEAVTRKMRDVAAETAEGVQAEMEVNPVNMI